jgi:hypothetical protein
METRTRRVLMSPHAGRVDRQQPGCAGISRSRVLAHRGEHRRISAVLRPAPMPFPHRLPRPELHRHITPRRPGPIPPDDALQRPPVIVPRPAATRPAELGSTGSITSHNASEITPARTMPASSPRTCQRISRHALVRVARELTDALLLRARATTMAWRETDRAGCLHAAVSGLHPLASAARTTLHAGDESLPRRNRHESWRARAAGLLPAVAHRPVARASRGRGHQ